jgi:hypothetical protein
MSSVHQSRARILFEVLCAFGLSASCVFAWMQTYATAFLPMAGIVSLYGLVHLFDMRRSAETGRSAEPVVPSQDVAPVSMREPELAAVAPPAYVQPPIDEVLAKVKRSQKPRKAAKARTRPAADNNVLPAVELPEPPVVETAPVVESEPVRLEVVEQPAQTDPEEAEAEYSAPVTPLFEPQPLVRTQRAAFGRKAG